jgi:hypothetical protein
VSRSSEKKFDARCRFASAWSVLGAKEFKEVTMDSSKTSARDERLAARKALLDQLARLRDQFSAGWLNVELGEAFATPQRAGR